MKHDFAADAAEVRALLGDTVEVYLLSRSREPAAHPPVTRVQLSFLPGDGTVEPTLYVDFDARPGSAWDGDADFSCLGELSRPGWMALMLPEDERDKLVATLPDGRTLAAPDGQGEYGEGADDVLARFMIAALDSARAEGVFDRIADRAGLRLTLTYQGNPVWEDPMPEF